MKHFAISFLLCFSTLISVAQEEEQQAPGKIIDKVVAVVGDEILLKSEIESQKLQLKTQQDAPKGKELECMVAEEMLLQKLLLHQAKIDSLEVTDSEVEAEIERRLQYFVSMLGDEQKFEEYYGKSIPQFREDFKDPIREQLLSQRMEDQINRNVNITPDEVYKYFQSLPQDSLPLINAKVSYSQVVAEPKIREEEKERTRRFLDSLRTEIIRGNTSMMVQAALVSEDPGSKYKGGCYDLMRRGSFVPEYEAAVFNTDEGSFSPVFESEYGFHFLQVKEKRGEYYKACHILKRPSVTPQDIEKAKVRLDTAKILLQDSLSFATVANRFSTDDKSAKAGGKVMNMRTGSTMHEVDNLDRQVFFVLDKMEVGEISDPVRIETEDGDVYYTIFRLDKRVPAHKANLKDDYQLVQQAAEGDKREEAFTQWVNETLEKTYSTVDDELMKTCDFENDWNKEAVSKY